MISIGFSTSNRPVSRLIRWFTKSKVSHSFILFGWLGQTWVLESDFLGVVMMPLSRFTKKNTIVEKVPLTGTVLLDLKPALQDLGKRYDFGGLFGNLWVQIGRWMRLKFHNPTDSSKSLFCSEFVVEFLQDIKYPNAKYLTTADTNPEDLRKFLGGD